MLSNLDVDRSKTENKAVFQISLTYRIFQFLVNSFFVFVIPILTFSYTIQHPSVMNNDLFGELMSNLVALAFAVFFFVYYRNPYRLIGINGGNLDENREISKRVFEKMEWEIIVDKYDHIIASPPSIYERQITLIFDKNYVLLSSVRFGRENFVVSFHQDNADKFQREFKEYKNSQN